MRWEWSFRITFTIRWYFASLLQATLNWSSRFWSSNFEISTTICSTLARVVARATFTISFNMRIELSTSKIIIRFERIDSIVINFEMINSSKSKTNSTTSRMNAPLLLKVWMLRTKISKFSFLRICYHMNLFFLFLKKSLDWRLEASTALLNLSRR